MEDLEESETEKMRTAGINPKQIDSLKALKKALAEGNSRHDELGKEGKELLFGDHLVKTGRVTDNLRPGEKTPEEIGAESEEHFASETPSAPHKPS